MRMGLCRRLFVFSVGMFGLSIFIYQLMMIHIEKKQLISTALAGQMMRKHRDNDTRLFSSIHSTHTPPTNASNHSKGEMPTKPSEENPIELGYVIKAKCPFKEGPKITQGYMLVAGISAIEHFSRREKIRSRMAAKDVVDKGVKLIFFLGLSNNTVINDKIKKESELHNDIVQGQFLDTYRNLTRKTILMVSWVTQYCLHTKFVLKMDDDMSMDFKALYKTTQDIKIPSEGIISGNCHAKGLPHRNKGSKWYVSKEEYPQSRYPDICLGPSYLLSSNSLPLLHAKISTVPFLVLEDVFLTGLVREKAGVAININKKKPFFCARGCPFRHG